VTVTLWNLGPNAAPPRYFCVEQPAAEAAAAPAKAADEDEEWPRQPRWPDKAPSFNNVLLYFLRAVAPFPGAVDAIRATISDLWPHPDRGASESPPGART
jgi:hypothetical protein